MVVERKIRPKTIGRRRLHLSGTEDDVAQPLRRRIRKVQAVVRSAALLAQERGFCHQASNKHQIRQLIAGAVYGLGQRGLPVQEGGSSLIETLARPDNAHLVPKEVLKSRQSGDFQPL